jgi:hypothetical protein
MGGFTLSDFKTYHEVSYQGSKVWQKDRHTYQWTRIECRTR